MATPRLIPQNDRLDAILDAHAGAIGSDLPPYRGHCYRVMNFAVALARDEPQAIDKIAIAAAHHDIGIWTAGTFDYLDPSRAAATRYLAEQRLDAWADEVDLMIDQHHKVTPYRDRPGWLVEPFRQADAVDVSLGWLRHGLPSRFVAAVRAHFPNAGFHRFLLRQFGKRFRSHPLNPAPMMKL